eukprot:CAMPEP_0119155118 /NCGR_PEP_ID=MMETSP1310-20130426/51582_1 /TAXON_ID=464262 /ORGANISM="Genus nov. species nov., Strain RCC2339" /LENGTH=282 /DNA_ID=CAMNT_0007147705 /DNA_START=401 /DNA_END=1250 /DNA_ORIENTATION=+
MHTVHHPPLVNQPVSPLLPALLLCDITQVHRSATTLASTDLDRRPRSTEAHSAKATPVRQPLSGFTPPREDFPFYSDHRAPRRSLYLPSSQDPSSPASVPNPFASVSSADSSSPHRSVYHSVFTALPSPTQCTTQSGALPATTDVRPATASYPLRPTTQWFHPAPRGFPVLQPNEGARSNVILGHTSISASSRVPDPFACDPPPTPLLPTGASTTPFPPLFPALSPETRVHGPTPLLPTGASTTPFPPLFPALSPETRVHGLSPPRAPQLLRYLGEQHVVGT